MRIYITSVLVDDQAKALDFYTEKLGFIVKHDIPMGDHRWLTVVSKEAPEGTELLLEPSEHPAAGPFKSALVNDGIPAASFKVDDLNKELRDCASLASNSQCSRWMPARSEWPSLMIHAAISSSSSKWSKEAKSFNIDR